MMSKNRLSCSTWLFPSKKSFHFEYKSCLSLFPCDGAKKSKIFVMSNFYELADNSINVHTRWKGHLLWRGLHNFNQSCTTFLPLHFALPCDIIRNKTFVFLGIFPNVIILNCCGFIFFLNFSRVLIPLPLGKAKSSHIFK